MLIPVILTLVIILILIAGNRLSRHFVSVLIDVRKKYSSSFDPDFYLSQVETKPEKHIVKNPDGLMLCFSHYKPATLNSHGCILFVHGIRYGKEYYYPMAEYLSGLGYHCLLPDLRAHGESEGRYCTYGFHEKSDLAFIHKYARKHFNVEGDTGIWGHSMGASIALQAMETDSKIKYGILEAPFADLNQVIFEYIRQKFTFIPRSYANRIIERAGKKARFDTKKVSPVRTAKQIRRPVMLVHGTDDQRIPLAHSIAIYNHLPTDAKILYEVKNATHYNLAQVWSSNYTDRTLEFIKKNSALVEYS